MTDLKVLVLTDDELTCLAHAAKRTWALPLGANRDADTVRTSAEAGERSLFARGLVGKRDGKNALTAETFDYLGPGLTGDPRVVLFVTDDDNRWLLQGMSIAVYSQDGGDVLEARAGNGLHHFSRPSAENLVRGLTAYVSTAYEEGFPDALPGVALSLRVADLNSGVTFRLAKGEVSRAENRNQEQPVDWEPSELAEVLSLVGQR